MGLNSSFTHLRLHPIYLTLDFVTVCWRVKGWIFFTIELRIVIIIKVYLNWKNLVLLWARKYKGKLILDINYFYSFKIISLYILPISSELCHYRRVAIYAPIHYVNYLFENDFKYNSLFLNSSLLSNIQIWLPYYSVESRLLHRQNFCQNFGTYLLLLRQC